MPIVCNLLICRILFNYVLVVMLTWWFSYSFVFTGKLVDIWKDIINALHNISIPLMQISEKLSIDDEPKRQPRNNGRKEVRIDDIMLTQNQFNILFGESERNGVSTLSRRWPNNKLPYEIDSSTIAKGSAEETMIKQVVARFNSDMNGCINIV